MQVLIEIKERDNHFEAIVTFPENLKEVVAQILMPERENVDWIMYKASYNGYLNAAGRFSSSEKASKWANNVSDRICLSKI